MRKKKSVQKPKHIHGIKIYTEVSKGKSWQKKKKKNTGNMEDRLRNLPRTPYSEFRSF